MAFVANQTPEDEQNKFGLTSPTTPLPPQSGGSSGAGAQGKGAAPGVGTPTQFGSNAAKLSDYLAANKDQVQNFGNQVAGNLTQGFNQAQGAIDQGFNNFNQQVNQSYTPPDASKVSQAASNPADFAKDPNNVSQFQGWWNNQYTGPQNFESTQPYSDINNQVNQAVQNASLVGTEGGLGTYLGNAGYNDTTPGMRSLDTALLQRSPDSSQAIRDAAKPYAGLNDYLSGKTQAADQAATTAQQAADQARTGLQNQFTGPGGVIPTFQNNLQNEVTTAQNQAQQRYQDAANAVKSLDVNNLENNPQTFADLGFGSPTSPNSFSNQITNYNYKIGQLQKNGQNATPFDFSTYLNPANSQASINAANIASPEEYANLGALGQLTGQDLSSILNQANISQAGTANKDIVNFRDPYSDLMNYYNGLINQGYGVPIAPPPVIPTPPPYNGSPEVMPVINPDENQTNTGWHVS